MNEDADMIVGYGTEPGCSDWATPVCKIVVAAYMSTAPMTQLAGENQSYVPDDCYQYICDIGPFCAARVMDGVALAKVAAISELRKCVNQMTERDYRVARFFVEGLPSCLCTDAMEVDSFNYLTIGWDLARFQNVSVSFSNEAIHVVGQRGFREIVESIPGQNLEAVYEIIKEVLYG